MFTHFKDVPFILCLVKSTEVALNSASSIFVKYRSQRHKKHPNSNSQLKKKFSNVFIFQIQTFSNAYQLNTEHHYFIFLHAIC